MNNFVLQETLVKIGINKDTEISKKIIKKASNYLKSLDLQCPNGLPGKGEVCKLMVVLELSIKGY